MAVVKSAKKSLVPWAAGIHELCGCCWYGAPMSPSSSAFLRPPVDSGQQFRHQSIFLKCISLLFNFWLLLNDWTERVETLRVATNKSRVNIDYTRRNVYFSWPSSNNRLNAPGNAADAVVRPPVPFFARRRSFVWPTAAMQQLPQLRNSFNSISFNGS